MLQCCRLVPYRADLASAYSPDAGKLLACLTRTPRLLKAANQLLILDSQLGTPHARLNLSRVQGMTCKASLGRGEQCLWSPTGSHLLLSLIGQRSGGTLLCIDPAAPQAPAALQVRHSALHKSAMLCSVVLLCGRHALDQVLS